jgi:hypothetical protein
MLANAANPLLDVSLKNLRPAAETLGLSLDIFEIRDNSRKAVSPRFTHSGNIPL